MNSTAILAYSGKVKGINLRKGDVFVAPGTATVYRVIDFIQGPAHSFGAHPALVNELRFYESMYVGRWVTGTIEILIADNYDVTVFTVTPAPSMVMIAIDGAGQPAR